MIGRAYAHSVAGKKPEEGWQPLEVHLANVAEMASAFAELFQSAEWAWNAGWLHDLGKADERFQAYLLRENGLDDGTYDATDRVNHSSAGAAFVDELLRGPAGRTLSYMVAGHHAGLPDWYASDTGQAALEVRLLEGWEYCKEIPDASARVIPMLRKTERPPAFVKSRNYHFWLRMLFSSLVDADYLDTEAAMDGGRASARSGFPSIQDLAQLFNGAIRMLETRAGDTPVNRIRAEIRQKCEQMAKSEPGVFSLTVPTGGGKTLSAMAFAIQHAVKYGKRRIIYVIPYTSIIEQTAQTLAAIFGRDNVLEHHASLDPEKETQRSRLAAENWDAPIIVTTNVQFFESLYAAKTSRCRKVHNIANSVVILDEAQLLPPEWLTPCIQAIRELTENYGVSIVLSTATQPALPGIIAKEIIPASMNLYTRLKRTEITMPSDMKTASSWETLAGELAWHEQVLCVVNTRRDCHDLYRLMPEGTVHLSALMCAEHRSRVIRYIKWRLRKNKPIRVISTQLVEAGVDIDFPVVYRSLAGIDSIAQAAGRCNREGRLPVGKVVVFVSPKPAPRGLLLKGENTTRELISVSGFDPQDPEVYCRYFKSFYDRVNDHGDAWLHDRLVKDVIANGGPFVQFRTAGEEFKLIDDQAQRSVIVRYKGNEQYIAVLRSVGPTREVMRRLQRYTVSINARMVDSMCADGRLEEVWPGLYAQARIRYDGRLGLDIFAENLPVEDLIV